MNTTRVVRTNIPPDRSVRIRVPESVPLGPVNITLVITSEQKHTHKLGGTAAELAHSPLFGLWADRTDITDSVKYARELRAQAERHHRDQARPWGGTENDEGRAAVFHNGLGRKMR